jgi:predicted double-glycine peptidase
MVALYLTGNPTYTPAYMADYALNEGYYVAGSGTAWSLMSEGCSAFGLSAQVLPLDEDIMAAALNAGKPIICALGPGDFTDNGHFIVLTGYTGDGFTLNDPNSPQRSSQVWTFDQLRDQINNLWAYERA